MIYKTLYYMRWMWMWVARNACGESINFGGDFNGAIDVGVVRWGNFERCTCERKSPQQQRDDCRAWSEESDEI